VEFLSSTNLQYNFHYLYFPIAFKNCILKFSEILPEILNKNT